QPRDTLDVRLMGIPPSQYGARQTSHPSAPPICVEDRKSEIRHIVIHGQNSARSLTIGQGETSAKTEPTSRPAPPSRRPYYPPVSQPRRPRPGPGLSDGASGNYPLPGSSTGNLSSMAAQVAYQVEVLRANYAAAVGLWINIDGTAELNGGRRTTTD